MKTFSKQLWDLVVDLTSSSSTCLDIFHHLSNSYTQILEDLNSNELNNRNFQVLYELFLAHLDVNFFIKKTMPNNSCKCFLKTGSSTEFASLWSFYCEKFIKLFEVAESNGSSSSMYRSIYFCRKVNLISFIYFYC